jgi:PadR family transcriptional regulator PadR
MPRSDSDSLLQGTLDVMILRTLAREERHGYAIARAIESASGARLTIEEGSLYPALHRLEKRGDVAARWGTTDTGRRARLYTISPGGRSRLKEQTQRWKDVSGAVDAVLGLGASTGGRPA